MILPGQLGGKVGRRRDLFKKASCETHEAFFFGVLVGGIEESEEWCEQLMAPGLRQLH